MSQNAVEKTPFTPNTGALCKKREVKNSAGNEKKASALDCFMIAYARIFDSVSIGEEAVNLQTKQMQYEVKEQGKLIAVDNEFNFVQIRQSDVEKLVPDPDDPLNPQGPNNPKPQKWVPKESFSKEQSILNNLAQQNLGISAVRSMLATQLTSSRQSASIAGAQISESANITLESLKEDSTLLQMLKSFVSQISSI